MNTITIPRQEYKELIERQERVEEELDIVKQIVQQEIVKEIAIKPAVLKRWARISRDMDNAKTGKAFNSIHEMRAWLKNL